MDILIVATSIYDDRYAADWQPDLRYTASFLRRNGIEAGFVYEPALTSRSTVERCGVLAPSVLFLDLSEENRAAVLSFIAAFKHAHPGVLAALGGVPPTLLPGDFFRNCPAVDLIVAGERDGTLLGTMASLKKGENLSGVAGVQLRDTAILAGLCFRISIAWAT